MCKSHGVHRLFAFLPAHKENMHMCSCLCLSLSHINVQVWPPGHARSLLWCVVFVSFCLSSLLSLLCVVSFLFLVCSLSLSVLRSCMLCIYMQGITKCHYHPAIWSTSVSKRYRPKREKTRHCTCKLLCSRFYPLRGKTDHTRFAEIQYIHKQAMLAQSCPAYFTITPFSRHTKQDGGVLAMSTQGPTAASAETGNGTTRTYTTAL